ncbi:MAG: hypothetical protein JF588_05370 [Caulobacterales bacterium]|nr:hypothetical protein [Caulobacterales bacterium]
MSLPAFTLDPLTLFGLAAVTAGLVCYAFEARSSWWVLGFAAANLAASVYGFLQGAWPFGLVELFWTAAGLLRFRSRRVAERRH